MSDIDLNSPTNEDLPSEASPALWAFVKKLWWKLDANWPPLGETPMGELLALSRGRRRGEDEICSILKERALALWNADLSTIETPEWIGRQAGAAARRVYDEEPEQRAKVLADACGLLAELRTGKQPTGPLFE